MEELATFAHKGMREADYLLTRRIPAFRRMMQRAGVSPSISRLLAERLTAGGEISYSLLESPLPELTPSAPNMPLLCSLTPRSSPLPPSANFGTSLPDVEPSPMTIPSEDIGAFTVTPSVIGLPTMTELVEEFMEDLLTQEFSPIQLDADIRAKGGGVMLRFHRFHAPAAAERPVYPVSSVLCFLPYSVAAACPSTLTVVPLFLLSYARKDALRSLDVS